MAEESYPNCSIKVTTLFKGRLMEVPCTTKENYEGFRGTAISSRYFDAIEAGTLEVD